MHNWEVLRDVLVLLMSALVLGAVCERLRQSAVLGYLLAGTLLGPNALGFVADADEVELMASLGAAMLLFTIGLEFSWVRLIKLGRLAIVGGAAQVIGTGLIGMALATKLGVSWATAVVLGAVLTSSSTSLVLRILAARSELDSMFGRATLGMQLVQDLWVIPLLLLVGVLAVDQPALAVVMDALRRCGALVILLLVFGLLFNYVVPLALGVGVMRQNRELPTLLAIVAGLGSAWMARQMGLEPTLGAFVAGMLLAGSPFATQIRADVITLRTLLMTLFISSVGMIADPGWIVSHWGLVATTTVAMLVIKGGVVWVAMRLLGLSHVNAAAACICMAQIGELGIVLALVARGSVLDEQWFRLVVAVTVVSWFLTPPLVSRAPAVARRLCAGLRHVGLLRPDRGESAETGHEQPTPAVVVIGYGPAGQAAAQAMERSATDLLVVDLNQRALQAARAAGHQVHVGDARMREVLEAAHVAAARVVIVALPDPSTVIMVIRLLRQIAPDATIVARARYHRYQDDLVAAGAHIVVDEEFHVGTRLAAHLRVLRREGGRPTPSAEAIAAPPADGP